MEKQSNFSVYTYELYGKGDDRCKHYSEDLKMFIKKDDKTIKLNGEEIKQLVDSLPDTFGGVY